MPSRALTILIGIVATILLGWVVHTAASILQPLVIALFLCSMLQPIVSWLAKRHIPPPVTVLVLVVLLLLGFARTGVWVRNQVEQFVGQPLSAPAKTVNPTDTSSDSAKAVEVGSDAELQNELLVQSKPLSQDFDGVEGTEESSTLASSDSIPAEPVPAENAETTESEVASQDGSEANPELVPEGATSADAEAEDSSTAEPEADEGDSSDEPGEDEADESEGEDGEAVEEVGWTGVRDFLQQKLHESNLPQPLVDLLVQNLLELKAVEFANNVLGGTVGFTRGLLLVLLYMLFIFAEQAIFRDKILAVADDRAEEAAETLDSIARGIQRYLSVKTVISLATGILCYSVLVGLRVPYAPLFGFMTFLLNYIPTFGSLGAGVMATVTAFASKGSWESVVIVSSTYLAVNMFLGSYIEPRILGKELNLSPLVILVSVVVWAGLWGVAGTFLAVPLTATLQIVLANNEATRPIAILLSSGPPREGRRLRRPLGGSKTVA